MLYLRPSFFLAPPLLSTNYFLPAVNVVKKAVTHFCRLSIFSPIFLTPPKFLPPSSSPPPAPLSFLHHMSSLGAVKPPSGGRGGWVSVMGRGKQTEKGT